MGDGSIRVVIEDATDYAYNTVIETRNAIKCAVDDRFGAESAILGTLGTRSETGCGKVWMAEIELTRGKRDAIEIGADAAKKTLREAGYEVAG
jgi:hypothetical protein